MGKDVEQFTLRNDFSFPCPMLWNDSSVKAFNFLIVNLSESHLTLNFLNDVSLLTKPGDSLLLRKAKDDVFFLIFPE